VKKTGPALLVMKSEACWGRTEVNIVAELGKTVYSVQDILNFEVDDILD
jgi:flagellar motor switch protein FliM